MAVMYILFFLFFGNCVVYCSSDQFFNFPKTYKPSEEFALGYKLEKKCIDEFEKDKKLKCTGCGGGGREDNKHMHIFHFFYYEEKTPDQAREMIIELLERAAAIFNSCEEYKKFCKDAPYTEKNFRIYLSFFKSNGRFLPPGLFCDCYAVEGMLSYHNDADLNFGLMFKETFEEAKAKLAEKHNLIKMSK